MIRAVLRRLRRLFLLLGAVILLVLFWTTVWRGMDGSVLSRVPILDEAHYLHRAAEVQAAGWLPGTPFTMSPLYTYLVAVTGSGRLSDENQVRLGPPPRGIRYLQALLWCGTAWLLWRVGCGLFGPRWGWGPALLWVGYGPAVVLAGQVLMEIPLVFVTTLAVAVSGGAVGPAMPGRRAAVAGALLGAAFLLRGTAIVLVVPVGLALMAEVSWRQGWRRLVPLGVALFVVVVPFVVLNSVRAGRLAPPALNGGVNLYIGNGPGADGFYRAFPGYDVENDPSGAVYLSEKNGRLVPDAMAADRLWAGLARQAMGAGPLRTLGLWGRKFRLHFVGVEIPQISSFAAWQKYVPLLRGLAVPWALLALGGLVGFVLGWRRHTELRPWLLGALLLVAVQSLFFVVTRYRLILVPAFALATVAVVRELARCRGRALVLRLAVVVLAAIAVWPWGLAGPVQRLQASGLGNEAVRWEHLAASAVATDPAAAADDLAAAEALYQQALEMVGDQADPWRGLARIKWTRGERGPAIALLTTGVARVPHSSELRRDLIGMLLLQKRSAEALPHLEFALGRAPNDAQLLENMVIAQTNLGQLDRARQAAARLVSAHPQDARGYLALGATWGRMGNLTAAEKVFAEGLRQVPGSASLQQNLDRVRELMATERN